MQRIPLYSTLLRFAGYQDQLVLLELGFHDGAVYHYFNVSGQTFQELLRAESKGAYFNAHIRHCFAYAKIHPAEPTRSVVGFMPQEGRR
jgi:hypothetical protein